MLLVELIFIIISFLFLQIIEFPVFKVNSKNFEIESEFHSYVRPTINPTLSTFCSRVWLLRTDTYYNLPVIWNIQYQLTGISQVQIDKQKPLGEVLKKFEKWMNSEVRLKTHFHMWYPNDQAIPNFFLNCTKHKTCWELHKITQTNNAVQY